MTVGLICRDESTGQVKLNLTDFTMRQINNTIITISGSGRYNVPGINAADYGAFIIPCYSYGYPLGALGVDYFLESNPPRMPRVHIETGVVVWTVGAGHVTAQYQINVVKYR